MPDHGLACREREGWGGGRLSPSTMVGWEEWKERDKLGEKEQVTEVGERMGKDRNG